MSSGRHVQALPSKKTYTDINQQDGSDFKRLPFLLKYSECKMLNTQALNWFFPTYLREPLSLRVPAHGLCSPIELADNSAQC